MSRCQNWSTKTDMSLFATSHVGSPRSQYRTMGFMKKIRVPYSFKGVSNIEKPRDLFQLKRIKVRCSVLDICISHASPCQCSIRNASRNYKVINFQSSDIGLSIIRNYGFWILFGNVMHSSKMKFNISFKTCSMIGTALAIRGFWFSRNYLLIFHLSPFPSLHVLLLGCNSYFQFLSNIFISYIFLIYFLFSWLLFLSNLILD